MIPFSLCFRTLNFGVLIVLILTTAVAPYFNIFPAWVTARFRYLFKNDKLSKANNRCTETLEYIVEISDGK